MKYLKRVLPLVSILISLVFITPARASLYNYYAEFGLKLPSVEARIPLAESCGIQGYQGLRNENIALEQCLRGNQMLGANPLPVDNYDEVLSSPFSTVATIAYVSAIPNVSSSVYTIYASDGTTPREKIYCTGTATSPYRLTGCIRGVSFDPVSGTVTETAGTGLSHSKNARIAITDNINFTGKALAILNGTQSTGASVLSVGEGINKDIYIHFDAGTTTNPGLKYTSSTNQFGFRRYGETLYREIPLSLRGTYPNYASLPATNNSVGDIAITTDDSKLYTWSGTTWVLAGGSSGAGTVYKTEKLGSESDGGDLKTFTLTAGSWPDEKFLLVYKNGQAQRIGATYDYTEIDSNTIQFTTTLASDDLVQMVVVSVDLYNPAWGSVNASIIPDTDNAYNLGNATHTFKDVYVTGTLYAGSSSVSGNLTVTGNILSGYGDGSDGALNISSGTTTINLGGLPFVTKNYTSLSITGTGKLNFSNPAPQGTVVIINVKNNVVLSSSADASIDLRGLGSTVASTTGALDAVSHRDGTIYSNTAFYASPFNSNFFSIFGKVISAGTQGADAYGPGGLGAGGLSMNVGGNLTGTSTINASGLDGVSASGACSRAGSGGGSGGDVFIGYKGTYTGTITINNAGGAGGYGEKCNSGTYGGGVGAGSSLAAGGAASNVCADAVAGTKKSGGAGGGSGTSSDQLTTCPGAAGGESDGGLIQKIY